MSFQSMIFDSSIRKELARSFGVAEALPGQGMVLPDQHEAPFRRANAAAQHVVEGI